MRVVSLVPSVTETLLAWGIEPVAVTRFCEQPRLRAVGGTKDPDVGAILELAPDLVIVNDEENRRQDADALVAGGATLHVTHVASVTDVEPCLVALAAALGLPHVLGPDPTPPAALSRGIHVDSAFVPIWRRPWMTLNHDTYGSSVLAALGVANVFADAPDRYPTITLDDAASRHPDLVLAPTEPYPFAERHLAEMRTVAHDARLVDGKDLFWWGVRTPAALERLAQELAS